MAAFDAERWTFQFFVSCGLAVSDVPILHLTGAVTSHWKNSRTRLNWPKFGPIAWKATERRGVLKYPYLVTTGHIWDKLPTRLYLEPSSLPSGKGWRHEQEFLKVLGWAAFIKRSWTAVPYDGRKHMSRKNQFVGQIEDKRLI